MNTVIKHSTAMKLINRQNLLKLALVLTLTIVSLTIARPSFSQSAGYSVPYHYNSVWNKPLGPNPQLHPYSAQMVQLLAGTAKVVNIDGINGAWSVPVYYADANTPYQKVCDADGYRGCVNIRVPSGLRPSPDSDAKTVIVDLSTNPTYAWSMWQMTKTSTGWTIGRGAFGKGNISGSGDGIHN